jgi:hypothetical protein
MTHVVFADAPAVLGPPLFHVPYFAIAARITAKLKTNPVSAMNLETS